MRVKNAFLAVADVGAAVRFYQGVLGLPLQFQDGDRWAQFKVDGFTWALAAPSEAEAAPGSNAVLTLEVEDLDAAVERLRGAGVRVAAIRDMGSHGRAARFYDPDGNAVQLYQAPR
ncbi:MAG: VOC family protein [Firmicutes bacterium]|nr:VOC family protein [Alicyclobacillaceae bacterium]MCL6497062.1 VOC family protein [Bacillota bacterium]